MLHNRRVSISRLLGLDDGIGKKEWRPDEKMEGEKVFVALPELFVFSHVSFFLFFYVTLAENVFDLILGWVYFGFGSLNGCFFRIRVFLLFWQRDFWETSTVINIVSQDREPPDSHFLFLYDGVCYGLLLLCHLYLRMIEGRERMLRWNLPGYCFCVCSAWLGSSWEGMVCLWYTVYVQVFHHPLFQDQHIITTSSALQSTSFYYSETSYSTVRRSQSSTTPPPTRQFSSLASNSTSGEVNII